MADAIALVVYLPLLAAAVVVVWRRPLYALYAFLVGLALHNLVMALLYGTGVTGIGIDALQAWKEVLLATAVARIAYDAARSGRPPFVPVLVDWLALALAAVACVYLFVGDADTESRLYALRHALIPVVAYFVGRSLVLTRQDLRSLGWTLLGAAGAIAVVGLLDDFLVSAEWWRDSGAVEYYRDELGFEYHGPAGLPDNWAFNAGAQEGVFRRLVSTFVSPLGAAFMFVVALLFAASPGPHWRRPRVLVPLVAVLLVALLFTISRSSLLVLAGGLVVLALARWRAWPLLAAAAVVALSSAFVYAYQDLAPETHFFPEDRAYQEQRAQEFGDVDGDLADPAEPSIRSHLTALRAGLEEVADTPQGHGLGNAGAIATRFDENVRAGESNYTEFGVEMGVVGLALFLAWNLALLVALFRRARWSLDVEWRWVASAVAASLAAVLVLAIQTDVYGVPWLAYCLWWLAGSATRLE